ncbi:MAG: ATP-binding protein [Clostridiales bacterium]|nr:ATP-binding protein [Clostridiales bacterium]
MERKRLPKGIENFEDIIRGNYYYADKTMLVRDILEDGAAVTLFTRPRRFGKSLNMSMLKSFFEIGTDAQLFDGLKISGEKELCGRHLGKYPVVSISLKAVEGLDFSAACRMMWEQICKEADRICMVLDVNKLGSADRENLLNLREKKGSLETALEKLSGILYKYYGKKTVILIDEYDVPLAKAYRQGYYDEMVMLIRNMFGSALKTNNYLEFAVLTGCLRVSKESIFTGLNNFSVNGITDAAYSEAFGFTDNEVKKMLSVYGLDEHYGAVKDWYDGYLFGKKSIYCPWDVVSYVRDLGYDDEAEPQNYWANTSGNDMIISFAEKADRKTRDDIENLIEGKSIKKKLRLDLTYGEIDKTIDNLWSVLFTTGYLTQAGKGKNGYYNIVIPNNEVRDIFVSQIQEWFGEKVQSDSSSLNRLCDAFVSGDTAVIEECLNKVLARSISIRDTQAPEGKKESFYHGMLIGILNSRGEDWFVESNREGGEGYPDIAVYREEEGYGFIIEVKYADSYENLEASARNALNQIEEKGYKRYFINKPIKRIKSYGIAFYKKLCKAALEE